MAAVAEALTAAAGGTRAKGGQPPYAASLADVEAAAARLEGHAKVTPVRWVWQGGAAAAARVRAARTAAQGRARRGRSSRTARPRPAPPAARRRS
jgi:hypothetical protein